MLTNGKMNKGDGGGKEADCKGRVEWLRGHLLYLILRLSSFYED